MNSVKQKWQNLEFDRDSMRCWVEHILPQISLNEERCGITHMFPIFLSKDDMLQVAMHHFVPMFLLHVALFSFNMLISRENSCFASSVVGHQLYPSSNHTFSSSHFLFYILKVKKGHEYVYTENKKKIYLLFMSVSEFKASFICCPGLLSGTSIRRQRRKGMW